MSTRKSKIAGAVYGFAIGDAMGATTEFMTDKQIKRTYGQVDDIVGGGWLNLKAGEVTDDTQMTMCVMDAAMESQGDIGRFKDACVQNFIDWYKSNPPDVGGQCARGIVALMQGARTLDMRSAGNGSLMRALPCALLNWKELNLLQGRLTHPSHECEEAISQYHDFIQDGLNDELFWGYEYASAMLVEPTGYVKDTFTNARVWANKPTFEECIIGAVNHGGDADTIAAIAGSLAGVRFGYEAIPKKWRSKLSVETRSKLDKFIMFCEEVANVQG